jgi:hypothetical protein
VTPRSSTEIFASSTGQYRPSIQAAPAAHGACTAAAPAPASAINPSARYPAPRRPSRRPPKLAQAYGSRPGVLAFKRGYAEWSEGDHDAEDELAQYTLAALDELRAATALG